MPAMKNCPVYRVFGLALLFSIAPSHMSGQEYRRWRLGLDDTIQWVIGGDLPHSDHIEMSGQRISCVLRYGVAKDSSFHATRSLVWPMLRTIPNNTHASLTRRFDQDGFDLLLVNGKPMPAEKVTEIRLDGTVHIFSLAGKDIFLHRQFFPATSLPVYCESYTLSTTSIKPYLVEVPESHLIYTTDSLKGSEGAYTLQVDVHDHGSFTLQRGKPITFSKVYSGHKVGEANPHMNVNEEFSRRQMFVDELRRKLILETPDSVLNTAFAFAKIRAAESIFETKGGPMHGPGGEAYYAAIWANDQAEYVGPFFPFLGYDYGNSASLNAYLHFARFMNDEFTPIPSSIIAEGTDIWNGAGDRGDAAMIAYGAARYALTRGDSQEAEQLWPLVQWCLEYCHRKLNAEGVVTSDTDELEGRFPAGSANLCTSSLYYDALNSAVYLGTALGKEKKLLKQYTDQASALRNNIEVYFGASVDGFDTYRYYKENDVLRAWICIPLTMGIYERKAGTIAALFSPALWTDDGLASVSGDATFWDRSTLYALRGVLAAGDTERAMNFLHAYSNRRLLGDHVPYPVEAYPEGSQRHLSAESGLYCRVFTEGLFGIRPTGLNSFQMTPRLPEAWPYMRLRHIHAFGQDFDILVERNGDKLEVSISMFNSIILQKRITSGDSLNVDFQEIRNQK